MSEASAHAVVARLFASHSLEIGAKDIGQIETAGPLLPQNTAVAIAHFPNEDMGERVRTAVELRRSGHVPIPHIAARRIQSADELSGFLERLRHEAAIDRVFVIAGDPERRLGPYDDALSVIENGALEGAGIHHVGIAGYPDGHPKISTPDLWRALEQKAAAIEARGQELDIVTQFSFDADAVLRWLSELRGRGIAAPVKIGVPGPISLRGLIHFAARSGVSASRSALAKYGTSIGKVIGTVGPLPFLRRLAEGLQTRDYGRTSLHFFTFGALHQTVAFIGETTSDIRPRRRDSVSFSRRRCDSAGCSPRDLRWRHRRR